MKTRSILRLAAFAVILGILGYFTAVFANGLYISGTGHIIDTSEADNVVADGSDFTGLVRLIGDSFNSLLGFVILLISFTFITAVSVIFNTIFRFTAFRKSTVTDITEVNAAKYLFIGITAAAVAVSLLLTRFTCIIPVILYTGIWVLFTAMISYLPLKERCREGEPAEK